MITFEQLTYFVKMVQAGNQTKAAEELFITRQSISKNIRELETEVGSPLFVKENGVIRLTPVGKYVYDSAVEQIQMFNRFVLSVKNYSQKQFSCVFTNQLFQVLPELKTAYLKYLREYSDVIVDMKETILMDEVYRKVAEGAENCGLILRLHKETPEELWSIMMKQVPVYAIMPKTHPLAGCEMLSIEDILEYPILCFGKADTFYEPIFAEAVLQNKLHNIIVEPQVFKASNYMIKNRDAIMLSGAASDWKRDYPNLTLIPIKDLYWSVELIGKRGNENEELCKEYGEFMRKELI